MNYDDSLVDLKNANISFVDIIEACPYDKEKNISGKFTEEIFYKEGLFYESPNCYKFQSELEDLILNSPFNTRVIYIYGFSGTGKSTLIRKYTNANSNYDTHFIDFQNFIAPDFNESYYLSNNETFISEALKSYLTDDYFVSQSDLRNVFDGLKSDFNKLLPHIFDSIGLEKFNSFYHEFNDYSKCCLFIKNLKSDNVIILFFIYLLINRQDKNISTKKCIIVFDNLDSLNIEYLSSKFLTDFYNALKNINIVFTRINKEFGLNIDFVKTFKFIFTLRTGNFADLNSNDKDKLFGNTEELNLSDYINSDFFTEVYSRRLNFANLVCPSNVNYNYEYLNSVIPLILNDNIFRRILLPLYNFDYRKVSIILLKILTKKYFIGNDVYKDFSNNKFSIIGNMIYGFVNILNKNDFIQLFSHPTKLGNLDPYCNPPRVILTVLINIINPGQQAINEESPHRGEVSLYKLIEAVNGIYSNRKILNVLFDCFECHKNSWVNLITIRNKHLVDRNSFAKEEILLDEVFASNNYDDADSEKLKLLEKIKISYNPSAFTFLRHINLHFEYYSNLAGNDFPLFTRFNEIKTGDFVFEAIINNVLLIVKKHKDLTDNFFNLEFLQKRNITAEDFKKSRFSFKFFRSKRDVGFFQMLRVLTSHLNYISTFRLFIVNYCEDWDEKLLVKFNKKIIEFIEEYMILLENCIDPSKEVFLPSWKQNLQFLKNNLKDKQTSIDNTNEN